MKDCSCFSRFAGPLRLAAVAVALMLGAQAAAQVFVYPRRPHQSQVRYFDFDWRYIDILVGPEAGPESRDLGPRAPYDQLRHVPGLDDGSPPSGDWDVDWRSKGARSAEPWMKGGMGSRTGALRSSRDEEIERGAADSRGESLADTRRDGRSDLPGDLVPPHAPPGATEAVPPPVVEVEPAEITAEDLPPFAGGMRLFFYEEARDIAERAAAIIESQYLYLIEQFDYVPDRTFPYILYSSYQEFLQTNLFPLQEGVLGVTSPRDLKLSLPYFGDHRLFSEVSLHELVHQFTIQKVRTRARQADVWGDPLEAMPLWYIEGIAEFYAKQGLDGETEMLVRDLVVNPDFMRGYVMLDFHEDRPWSALWTYRVGQARVYFLEEVYGDGTIQTILDKAPLLVGAVEDEPQARNFPALLERVTGDAPDVISRKFEDWVKRRSFEAYLDAEQTAPVLEPLDRVRGRANALSASPDGNLLAYRSLDFDTGRTRIFLVDRRDLGSTTRLAQDAVPGVESLHPIQVRNFDLADDKIVFVAQAGGRDIIYVQPLERQAELMNDAEPAAVEPPEAPLRPAVPEIPEPGEPIDEPVEIDPPLPGVDPDEEWRVRISTQRREAFDVAPAGIIAVFSPAFEPDGDRVGFVGLDSEGIKNVYVLEPGEENGEYSVRQLTDDYYAQRQVTWARDGIVFNSDATEQGRYNLFLADVDQGEITRLTVEASDHFDPRALPDGRLLFTSYSNGRADLHEVVNGEIVRLTDIETGLFDSAPGPNGAVWALFQRGGQRRPVLVPSQQVKEVESISLPTPGLPKELVRRALVDDEEYRALSLENWELGNLFGFVGAGAGGVFGQVLATGSDRLRDHVLVLNLFVFGSLELTDGYLMYINQQRRFTWGAGPFQTLRFRRDRTFETDLVAEEDRLAFTSGERFFGGMFSMRYPFHRFSYVQGDLKIGGVDYFLQEDSRDYLRNPERNPAGQNLLPAWEEQRDGIRFQTETSARIGYDTIRYHPGTGPLAGGSAMLEGTLGVQPFEEELFGNVRLDGERYFPIWGRTHFFLRGGAGSSFGGDLARQFFLSSFDTIRGVEFGNENWLLGSHFLFSTAEVQFPLNALIRLVLFTDIEGIVGVDFGGVSDELTDIFDQRVLNLATGFNFGFGPLVFRLHFARPFDIGAPAGLPTEPGDWVTNFSLGWLYF